MTMSTFDASLSRSSYCVNTLYRIEMIERVIKQTQSLVNKTRTDLEQRLEKMVIRNKLESEVEALRMRIRLLREEVVKERKRLDLLKHIRNDQEVDVCEKGIEMSNRFQRLKREREAFLERRKALEEVREKLVKASAQLVLRRKQLVTQMVKIYPIVAYPDNMGGFSVANVHLPNAEDFGGHDDLMISVALGYVTHLLSMISKYLDVPLRYQLVFAGSRSFVYDHLNPKLMQSDRLLPLFSKNSGKDKLYFKYAVFLLNHNIAQLRHHLGLSTRDLKQTLPNMFSMLEEKLLVSELDVESDLISEPRLQDDYLSREMEMMRNGQEVLWGQPYPVNNMLAPNDRFISRSLDVGLNEITPKTVHQKTHLKTPSIAVNVGSNSIPRLHSPVYNLSDSELNRVPLKNGAPPSSNPSDIEWLLQQRQTGSDDGGGQSSTGSSPRLGVQLSRRRRGKEESDLTIDPSPSSSSTAS